MELAVLSDIHGNYIALKKCIDFYWKEKLIHLFFSEIMLVNLPFRKKQWK